MADDLRMFIDQIRLFFRLWPSPTLKNLKNYFAANHERPALLVLYPFLNILSFCWQSKFLSLFIRLWYSRISLTIYRTVSPLIFVSFANFLFETFGIHPILFTINLLFLEMFTVRFLPPLFYPYYGHYKLLESRHPTQSNMELSAPN